MLEHWFPLELDAVHAFVIETCMNKITGLFYLDLLSSVVLTGGATCFPSVVEAGSSSCVGHGLFPNKKFLESGCIAKNVFSVSTSTGGLVPSPSAQPAGDWDGWVQTGLSYSFCH